MLRAKKTFIAFLCATFPSAAPLHAEAKLPRAEALVDMILKGPETAYKGHLMISMWSDRETKAEDVNIYFTPPNKYRIEFLRPDGSVDRVVLSNGNKEQTQLLKNDQIVQDYVSEFPPKFLAESDEKALVLQNYKVSVKEGEKVLGRPTWTVEWTPLTPGKPIHQMKVDRATNVALETKQFLSEGSQNGVLTRFTDFEPNAQLASTLFLPEVVSKTTGDESRSATALDEQRAKDAQFFSKKLLGGFAFESVNYLEVTGKPVKHIRYTDGVMPLSLFQTPVPVKIPGSHGGLTMNNGAPVNFSSGGNVCYWEKNKQYFTLVGDIPEPLLKDISRDLR